MARPVVVRWGINELQPPVDLLILTECCKKQSEGVNQLKYGISVLMGIIIILPYETALFRLLQSTGERGAVIDSGLLFKNFAGQPDPVPGKCVDHLILL